MRFSSSMTVPLCSEGHPLFVISFKEDFLLYLRKLSVCSTHPSICERLYYFAGCILWHWALPCLSVDFLLSNVISMLAPILAVILLWVFRHLAANKNWGANFLCCRCVQKKPVSSATRWPTFIPADEFCIFFFFFIMVL